MLNLPTTDFRTAYGQVGGGDELAAGFHHKTVNHYGNRFHSYDVSLPLWQYKLRRLSQPFCVARIIYEGKSMRIEDDAWVSAKFEASGSADAVVFWVDYLYRSASGTHKHASTNDRFNVISTSSSSHRQTIRKLLPSVSVSEMDLNGSTKILCRSHFDRDDSECVEEDHQFLFKIVKESNSAN